MDNLEILKIDNVSEQNKVFNYMILEEALNIQILKKEEELKSLKAKSEDNKANLLQAMINWNIKSLKTNKFTITRIDETTRITLDSKKLKEDLPDVYEKYSRKSKVKANLRIKERKNDNITQE